MSAIYLYAVVNDAPPLQVGSCGLPNGSTQVTTMPVGSLAAAVSEYHGPAPATLSKPELLRTLAIHQAVIERLMQSHRVLPARFGTVVSSTGTLHSVLARCQQRLLSTFEQIGDSIEIEVAATWDLARVFAEIGKEPEIAALASAVAAAAGQSEQESMVRRVQVGEMVKESLERRRAAFRERLMTELMDLVADVQPNPLLNDEMVMNVAFLIKRLNHDAFFTKVHSLDHAFENRLNFRCIGPLPPYSFATVTVVEPHHESLQVARRLLQLGEHVSEAEIHVAYRRMAAVCHPDRNQGDPSANDRFARLAKAHALLLEYVRAQRANADDDDGPSALPDRRFDLSAAAMGNAPLLAVTRSAPELISGGEIRRELVSAAV